MPKDTAAHACFCETCKLDAKISRLLEGKKPDDYLPVLAKLAGEALATYDVKTRDQQAKRFISFMQELATGTSREPMDTFMDALIKAAKDAGFQVVNLK